MEKEYFLNRELSWLKFNTRVLQEAVDRDKPLLEKLKFLAIAGSNLDEFFMVRVSGLRHKLDNGINKPDSAGYSVEEQLGLISVDVHQLVKRQYRYYKQLMGELARENIIFCRPDDLPEAGRAWLEEYFRSTVYPVATPMAVDASRPFPFLANRSLNLAVMLERSEKNVTAVVQVPGVLPRFVEVPGEEGVRRFILLEELMAAHCSELFYGYRVRDVLPFRITRNADLEIDEEEAEDLLVEVEKSLRQRKRGQAVRLEIGMTANKALHKFVVTALKIQKPDIYAIDGPIDLTYFMKFAAACDDNRLCYPPLTPRMPADLQGSEDIFAAVRERDILLHHPYESFDPVVDLIRRAAADPEVLAIKQTLYRVGGDSPVVRALAQAAENGKQVTVLVELRARFDEETNIHWAKRLEEAGCHVIYGLVGLKAHAKITLAVRREDGGIRRYVHLGTGNYNHITAKIYTDIGLMTADEEFGEDASAFFNVLSGYSDPPEWNRFTVAPLGLRARLINLIEREMNWAAAGKPGRIIAKMNALLDNDLIVKLYEASQSGVEIDLIVRGICVLRPGIGGLSENIAVRSIVGRFLEHSRIFYFANGGEEEVYLSSADWMPRNLNHRVELMFPVQSYDHRKRLRNLLELLLRDNRKAHRMTCDGEYRRVRSRGATVNAQEDLLNRPSV